MHKAQEINNWAWKIKINDNIKSKTRNIYKLQIIFKKIKKRKITIKHCKIYIY